ncbi:TatD family hydrolase [Candidatus Daviesbacteria bacterium]|nr:TatD family hydrolase [Candidatus Daviesbacteria bacterium]
MNLIDTHAHLYWKSFKQDFDEVVKKAVDAGISVIINVGVDLEKSQEALRQVYTECNRSAQGKLSQKISIYSTIGIHPHEALRLPSVAQGKPSDIDKLEQIYKSNPEKVVGIGECGLDYFFQSNPGFIPPSISIEKVKDLQKELFQAQIDLAKKLNLPLIVHCRDDRSKDPTNSQCWDDALEMIGNQLAILHCYSGLIPTTNYILPATNLYVSFAANITYPKNEYLREAVKILPLDRILLETDSPFLAPQSKRGQRNEPASVVEIAQLIAELKGISVEEVAKQTTQNAKRIFNIT